MNASMPAASSKIEQTAERLTNRQREVLLCKAVGLSNAGVAEVLLISCRTVEHHLSAIYAELRVSNIVQALKRARELDLIPRD